MTHNNINKKKKKKIFPTGTEEVQSPHKQHNKKDPIPSIS